MSVYPQELYGRIQIAGSWACGSAEASSRQGTWKNTLGMQGPRRPHEANAHAKEINCFCRVNSGRFDIGAPIRTDTRDGQAAASYKLVCL